MENVKFSVLLSVYEREKPEYLNECFASLASQSLLATEVVLVKDGPLTPALESVIREWELALNIKQVELLTNMGLSYALKVGVEHCSYDLIARMDTDDVCLSHRFKSQIDFLLENPSVDIVGGGCVKIDELGLEIGRRDVIRGHANIIKLIWTCPLIHPTVVFRKERLNSVGGYDAKAPHRQEDYELWIRCALGGLNFANIDSVLIKYRTPADYLKKNSIAVGLGRIKVGLKAVWHFDFRFVAIIGVFYPFFRSLLPLKFQYKLEALVSKYRY
ncbi:Glyco_trans_2-like domain-containing protein [Vibrio chagasii]|uniref:glycosyltransferase n=1 Tax=Vibrio chagasii TaxID=170679 RepID=UPI00337D868D|nr:Glyco_trans_2-like domain-containing protein [Vibrio chagasii]CAH7126309.1 Glyco_trans_2-like domain-containing protein [Vibrio chagasii]